MTTPCRTYAPTEASLTWPELRAVRAIQQELGAVKRCSCCGLTTRRHTLCTDGPPPPHGLACECPFCDGARVENIVAVARHFVDGQPHPEMVPTLRLVVRLRDEVHERNRQHWERNRAAIRRLEQAGGVATKEVQSW